MTTRVLFHFPCPDGFGAAWSYLQYLLLSKSSEKVAFHKESHRWETTKSLLASKSTAQDDIIYFDICPHLDMLEPLHAKAKSLKVIDHHKTAMEECGHLSYCFFDMKRSGMGLAWDLYAKDKLGVERPFMVDLIEDSDLWRNEIPDGEKYRIVMETFRYDFDTWSHFSNRLENPEERKKILVEGTAMDAYRQTIIRRMMGGKMHKLVVGGHEMPAVNGSILQSPIGNHLAHKGPAGAVYYTQGRQWNFSLRSTDEGLDVSEIAKQYGGGGHRNASGFAVKTLEDLVASDIRLEDYTEQEQRALLADIDPMSVMTTEPVLVLGE